ADLLVLPEYAVPLALLPAVVMAAGPSMTVVAGTHTVTVDGWRRSGIYERLGLSRAGDKPVIGTAVAPVIQGGRARALLPKRSASSLEPDLIPGPSWAPVDLGRLRLGVLPALDFMSLRDMGAPSADECALYAVMSSTPFSILPHTEQNVREQLASSGRLIA